MKDIFKKLKGGNTPRDKFTVPLWVAMGCLTTMAALEIALLTMDSVNPAISFRQKPGTSAGASIANGSSFEVASATDGTDAAADDRLYTHIMYNAPQLTIHQHSTDRKLRSGDIATTIAFYPNQVRNEFAAKQAASTDDAGACTGFWCGEVWDVKCSDRYSLIMPLDLVVLTLSVVITGVLRCSKGIITIAVMILVSIGLVVAAWMRFAYSDALFKTDKCFIGYILAIPDDAYTQDGKLRAGGEVALIWTNGVLSVVVLLILAAVAYYKGQTGTESAMIW
jgi:hypothetical protein